jgi:hypothetical protein
MQNDPWTNIPAHYKSAAWAYDYDERNSVFFVHCGGHRICDSEDSEVAHAICRAFNSRPQIGEDRPHAGA